MSSADKEIEWLRTEILPKILNNGKLVENYSESSAATFKVKNIDINFIGSEEAFMLTTCYRATIDFEYEDKAQQCKLVVKKTPDIPEALFDGINFGALFNNEINFYTRSLPELQQQAEGNFAAPKYYYSQLERNFATIILGDFAADGWCMTKDKINLSLEHILLAAAYIGNFHALGFALKHTNRTLFDALTSDLKESRFANDDMSNEFGLKIKTGIKRLIISARKYQPEVSEEFLQQYEDLLKHYFRYGRQRVLPVEPLSTICHGDYLRNNVAYKYDDDADDASTKQPIEIMMFDYQTLRVSSPMIDLSVFLSLSAFAEIRQKHFDQIFDTYIEALNKSYESLTKQKTPEYLSRESLLKEYIRYFTYSTAVASFFLLELIEPEQISSSELINRVCLSDEDIIADIMTRGGDLTDHELAKQMFELFELSRTHGVNIAEGIKL